MKKALFSTLLLCSSLLIFAQNPVPIPDSYLTTPPISLCKKNAGFGIRNLDLSLIGPPQNFTISLQIYVVTSIAPSIPPYPTTWPPYPDCYSGLSGNQPVVLENCAITDCSLNQNLQPAFNQTTHTYDWAITSCSGSVIEQLDYSVYLDCSLFSLINNASGALYLVQYWSYNGIPFPTQPLPVQISFPYFTAPNVQNVDANTGNTEVWNIVYQNTGTGDAHVSFMFDIDQCNEYTLLNTDYSLDNGISWNACTLGQFITPSQSIAPGSFIQLRQSAKITGCAADCGPVSSPPPTVPKFAHFKWRCNAVAPNNYCSSCYEEEYKTELHFVSEQPKYTVTRITPNAGTALQNNLKCQGDNTIWTIEVKNTSLFTTLDRIDVELLNPIPSALSLLHDVSYTPCPAPCNVSLLSTTPINPIPDEITDCISNVPTPLEDFIIRVQKLGPNESIQFIFKEFHCCSQDVSLLNAPKFFNQFQLSARCTTACGNIISPDASATNYAVISGSNGISGYNTEPLKDINLELSFSNPNSSTVVSAPLIPQSPYFKNTPENYEINILELFGNIDDAQALGFSNGLTPSGISGIIKVEINVEDGGLLLANPYDAFFEMTDQVNPLNNVIWSPFHYDNFPCLSYAQNGGPCFYLPGLPPTPIPCEARNYCLYFRTSDLPSVFDLASALTPISIQLSKFKYSLYACCFSAPQTNFKVSFSILKNTDHCSPGSISDCSPSACFLPLSSVSGHTTVHCPGCKFPGIIVNSYRIERTTLGFPDADNDRSADNTASINYTTGQESNNYSAYSGMARSRSTYGDQLTDYSVSNFTDGDPSNGGYSYCNMKEQQVFLNHLQLFRDFENSGDGPDDYNLEVTGFDLYIDDPAAASNPCIDCEKFYNSTVTNPTIFHVSVDASSPIFQSFFERLPYPSDDTKLLFTFSETVLTNIITTINSLPAGVTATINNSGITSIDYDIGQIYRLRTHYKVCGNQHVSQNIVDPALLFKDVEINDYMYLTGAPKNLSYILASGVPSNLPLDKRPKNSITELENSGLKFNIPSSPTCPLLASSCTTCAVIDQSNFGDAFYFFCEPSGGQHQFVATDMLNNASYQSNFLSQNCNYSIQITAANSLRRLSQQPTFQLFPFEYKPLNIFPASISVQTPAGWITDTDNGGNVTIKIESKRPDGGWSDNSFQVAATTNPFTINIGQLGAINCFENSNPFPTSGLFNGDEFQIQKITIPCRPDPACPTSNSVGVADDINVTFNNNISACQAPNSGCSFSFIQNNLNTLPNLYTFNPPNPNLQCTIWPAIYNAFTHEIAWNFEFLNPNAGISSTLGIGTTPAQNVFLSVPDLTAFNNYLHDWEIEYTISANYPYGYSPVKTTSPITITNPSTGNYFWLIPHGLGTSDEFEYFPANGQIYQGTIKAKYDPCTQPAEFDFVWGWNCIQTVDPVAVADLCSEVTSTHVILNKIALLTPDETASLPFPSSYTACGPVIQNIKACFKSTAQGELKPLNYNFSNITNLNVSNINIVNCNGNATYTITPSGSTTGSISVSNGIGNEYMYSSDCFCIAFDVEPLCNFGDLTLPTVDIQWEDYCGDGHPSIYDLPAVPPSTNVVSSCTDCFMVTKSALNTNAIASGIEPVTFEITITGNNDPGSTSPALNLWDDFPIGFSAIGANIFGSGGSGNPYPISAGMVPPNGTLTYTVTGTITNTNPNVCNTAVLANSTMTPIDDDTACVFFLGNCVQNATYTIKPLPGQTSINLSTIVSNTAFTNATSYDLQGQFIIDQDYNFASKTFYCEPASEIVVNAGKMLTFSTCTLSACSKMWKGITLLSGPGSPGAVLNISRSIVNDALYAVYANNHTIVNLNESSFNDNYVSLYVPPVASAFVKGNSVAISIYYCNFHGSGTMKPMYQCANCPVVSNYFPKAGIEVGDISLKLTGSGVNTFTNMSNGILGYRSNLRIKNCTFSNIKMDNTYYLSTTWQSFNSFNGSAIFGSGIYQTSATGMRAVTIDQSGFGHQQGISQPTFENCDFGIYADQIELKSDENVMMGLGIGYRSRLARFSTIISNNFIDAFDDGIDLFMFDMAEILQINNNEIIFGDVSNGSSYSWAIRAEGQNLPTSDMYFIYENTIYFRQQGLNSFGGIYSNATNGLNIIDNRIFMDNNHNNHDGIYMSGCNNIKTLCNHIRGDGINYDKTTQSSIAIFNGDDAVIACNDMDGTDNGIFVLGNITGTGTLLRGNEINNHVYGLHYGQNSIVTEPQNYKGNKWNVSQPAIPAGYHAWNEGTLVPYQVNSSTSPLIPINQSPLNWFFSAGAMQDFVCNDGITDYCQINYPFMASAAITDLDRLIANDSIENDPYTQETKWILNKSLYDKIDENPNLLSDSILNNFFINSQNTTIAELKPIEDAKSMIFTIDSILKMQFMQNDSIINQKLEGINVQMNLLDSAIMYLDSTSVESIVNNISNEAITITDIVTKSDSILTQISNLRNVQTNVISNENNLLSITNIIEFNEQAINNIYLNYIAKGNMNFSPQQIQLIKNIASQCPLAGGNAVFRARSIYALIDKTIHYNDFDICLLAGIAIRKKAEAQTDSPKLKVYPNPASDKITLEYESSEAANFALKSSTGQNLFQFILKGGDSKYEFSTKALVPGVYYYTFVTGNDIYNGKIVIVR